ncbi:MAG TPA: PilZ domain-containing protein [Tepidisphaeraceae bacterium]|jgi:c-di-GMP-binding flagellar brake protein YcgR
MATSDKEIVSAAIARNAGIVISFPSAGIVRHHKSRFLAETEEGIWAEVPAEERLLVNELITNGQRAGVSFRQGPVKIVFTAPLKKHQVEYRINDEMVVEAVLLQAPTEIKTIQRRSNYRVAVPEDAELRVRVWRIGPGVPVRDRPMAKQEVRAQLRNISLGGVGVIFEGDGNDPPKVSPEDRLRVQLMTPQGELILEGRMRYPEAPKGNTARAGIQFKSLDKDIDGRQILATLTRIVGELTRAELRRLRLGPATVTAA